MRRKVFYYKLVLKPKFIKHVYFYLKVILLYGKKINSFQNIFKIYNFEFLKLRE